MSTGERNQKLARAFQFTSADVLLNQQGKIADSQKLKLEMFRRGRVMGLAAFGIIGGIALLACIGASVWALFNADGGITRLAIPLGIGFVLLAMAAGAANFYVRSRELITGKVSRIEGPAKPVTREYGEMDFSSAGVSRVIRIGDREFPLVTEEQYNAFEEGAAYRAFYVKNYPMNVLLSVEAL